MLELDLGAVEREEGDVLVVGFVLELDARTEELEDGVIEEAFGGTTSG